YGRATLSTVSFRGTSPSHTQVTWNGMKINSPMLGMTDFSMIPSYFIDDASLLHGTSSVNETGGGLGGAVRLSTKPAQADGFGLQYVQGVGSFKTFDEFLRLTYGDDHWQLSTRAVYSSSPNDYKYRNRDKKENIYDDEMNIIGSYYPIERNRSGSYKDLHLLQEIYYNTGHGDRFGLNAWYINSNRELQMLTTDYGDAADFDNRQREHTFRGVLSWDHLRSDWKLATKAGYIHTWMAYDYERDPGNGIMQTMTRSRSRINTFYGQADGEYYLDKWLFTASLSAHQHMVESRDKNIILQQGNKAVVGYDTNRMELSSSLSAKWRPSDRVGVSAVLREELFGDTFSPLIPALFVDGVISQRGNIMAKASLSRNYRFPTLNDLYFLPGGNPDLKPERGWTYDASRDLNVYKEQLVRDYSNVYLRSPVTKIKANTKIGTMNGGGKDGFNTTITSSGNISADNSGPLEKFSLYSVLPDGFSVDMDQGDFTLTGSGKDQVGNTVSDFLDHSEIRMEEYNGK
ncbi:MAG: TonB-dependent receptor, partial [Alistipes sp.]|nr:TonB-dependent receptor [Alistipes sp.]